ncbi:hypothetical protein DEIPH_ctg040orf0038 [Deinococcus phoenicis]|uniref:Uncharacterized protein n=1 Tax=Deinococcus phoenicis TaxID=1476583 RepID=A0A016QN32_9DEIO|nr:hypothetical protein [Deinococcus phoenicis]EYB67473.1 hypothetical protein DEIPH_ctg040orf0038 [Deinococcus phoenicis]
MTPQKDPSELAGLPAWLYPAGFWVAVVLLAVGVLFPDLAAVGVTWVGLVPVLAALWVAVTAWNRDRRLSLAALAALGGLVVVYVVKSFI